MQYKDVSFNISKGRTPEKIDGLESIIMAIRNIILSRQGNYPFTPQLGLNIEKYNFEILDDITINKIKSDLMRQINMFIPAIDNVEISVSKVSDTINGELINAVGISVMAMENGSNTNMNFLVVKEKENISVYNETRQF